MFYWPIVAAHYMAILCGVVPINVGARCPTLGA